MRAVITALLLAALSWAGARAQESEAWRAMNLPVEPFRIIGNLYYVGASDVTAFLIPTPDGHILIDSGFEETVPLIRSAVGKLGFEFEKIRVLLNSHAHIDHGGGLARIKELTGAKLMASELDAPLLERGGAGDDVLGDRAVYEPVKVDRKLKDGDTVELGGVTLTARVTAGHTRGCTSWTMEVEEAGQSHLAVSVCSLSILDGTKFLGRPTYPGIAEDFSKSFETLRSLPCDVFLASHGRFFRLNEKRQSRLEGAPGNPFIDPDGYRRFIDRAEQKYDRQLAREKAENASPRGVLP